MRYSLVVAAFALALAACGTDAPVATSAPTTPPLVTPTASTPLPAEDPATAPQCGTGEVEVFNYNFAGYSSGSVSPSADSRAAEAAVEYEADRLLMAHDPHIERDGSRYIVRRGGRPVAVFTTQKRSGRYVVNGGELCSADAAPR